MSCCSYASSILLPGYLCPNSLASDSLDNSCSWFSRSTRYDRTTLLYKFLLLARASNAGAASFALATIAELSRIESYCTQYQLPPSRRKDRGGGQSPVTSSRGKFQVRHKQRHTQSIQRRSKRLNTRGGRRPREVADCRQPPAYWSIVRGCHG